MEFTRKRKVKGKSSKHYREWYDETKQYRITWRNEVFGVAVTPAYYACVRCYRSPSDRAVYWGFVGRRGPYKTRQSATEACEKNQRIWKKFLSIEGRSKVTEVRNLEARARIGSGKSSHSMLCDLPVWVVSRSPQRLLDILCGSSKNQKDLTETSTTSDDGSPSGNPGTENTQESGPASNAGEQDGSSTQTTNQTPSRETTTAGKSSAEPAEEAEKAPAKRASRRTPKRSPRGKSKGKSTTASAKRSGTRSRSSRKK